MEAILNNIVLHRRTAEECVERQLLEKYTHRIPEPFVKKLRWAKLEHLYILGTASPEAETPKGEPLLPGAYEDTYRKWVLIVGAEDADVQKYVNKCSGMLEKLVVRFTNLEQLDASRLTGLKSLMLERNEALTRVKGLEQLTELRKLYLTKTAVRDLPLGAPMPNVAEFLGNGTPLENADFIRMFPGLTVLNLAHTALASLPPVAELSQLKVLKLTGMPLTDMQNAKFPEGLASLSLDATPMRRLPDSIRDLRNLTLLNISHMSLENLPGWMPELGLDFSLEKTGSGIRLYKTQVEGVDMRIFTQPREMILQWFRSAEDYSFITNGAKVVLVGEGSAILRDRLCNEGRYNPVDWGDESRKIFGRVFGKEFSVYGQRIHVQFWDLYRPDHLYKLQPRFFRDRTVYVVTLIPDNESSVKIAERMLKSIQSCAPNAPVMLVVDGTEAESHAALNRVVTPGLNLRICMAEPLAQVGREAFNRKYIQRLLELLLEFPELMRSVPKAWSELAAQLKSRVEPYLHLEAYHEMGQRCGIDDENVRTNLLHWFTDLGICYYSDATEELSSGVLLNPDWLLRNVMVLWMYPAAKIRNWSSYLELISIFEDWRLDPSNRAAKYLLNLMRSCRLTIPVNTDREVILDWCSVNQTDAFRQYLKRPVQCVGIPCTEMATVLLHRLMYTLRDSLDVDSVWYRGACFRDDRTGEYIALEADTDEIRIFTNNHRNNPLLDRILAEIRQEPRQDPKRIWDMDALLAEKKETEDPNLNEIRVIFLGDGEAGKSLLIDRLLELRLDDKEDTGKKEFTGDATPGVMMTHGTYELVGGRKVRLNFWDFGGQEILHSMHRIFVTEQTVCVIVLNARSDTQDDRARYWLRYIRSVSANMRVILVLNKIDQNINASVNENALRRICPETAPLIRMSALKNSDQEIRDNLLRELLGQIGMMKALDTKMPENWKKLRDELQTLKDPYIRKETYEALCRKHGIAGDAETYGNLLNWFNVMGLIYRCDDPGSVGTYAVIRPEWVTNALYAILYNRHSDVKNGVVSRNSLYDLLKNTKNIQCVDQERGYKPEEVDYVIQIMRRNNLSYCVTSPGAEEQREFVPMLCLRNESETAGKYADDPNAIEFWIRFEYLPDTLMFYLMVDNFALLDRENIWLTGARFVDPATGASAIVKREENILKLYVRSDRFYPSPAQYRDRLRHMVDSAVKNHLPELKILEELVVEKRGGELETFDYKRMDINLRKGITHCYSKVSGAQIAIRDILDQTNSVEQERKERLLEILIGACMKLQEKARSPKENDRNKDVAQLTSDHVIQGKKLIVKDETPGGTGKTGSGMGERDMVFYLDSDRAWVILEALNIKGMGMQEIENWQYHLRKLMKNYNPYGLRTLILLSYVNCSTTGFGRIWKRYYEEVQKYSPADHPLMEGTVREIVPRNPTNYLKIFRGCYGQEEAQMEVYHLFVRLDTEQKKAETK